MTASILKQDPNTWKVKQKQNKTSAIYYDKTKQANFWGKTLLQATKQHLNNS